MGALDIIRGFMNGANGGAAPAAAPAAGDPTANGNNSVPGSETAKPDGTGPNAFPAVGEGDKSPLAGFSDLWEKGKDEKQPASMVPTMNVDHEKLMKAAASVDFTKTISPELLQKATQGDPAALAQAISQAAQAGFAQSAAATAKIVENALQTQAKTFKEEVMPDILRRERIGNALSENPLADNPAVAPMLTMLRERLAQKYPMASAQEIAAKTNEYFLSMSTEIAKASGKQLIDAPAAPAENGGMGKSGEDWSKFFGV